MPKRNRLYKYLFDPIIKINRVELNLIAVFFITVGLITGTYLTLTKLWPRSFATTQSTKTLDTSTQFSQGTASSTSVSGSGAGAVVQLQGTAGVNSTMYRRKITFNNSAQAENLTNFPVLIKLDSTRIDYSKVQDAGQDLRFTDSDGTTLLSYEIEKWDETGNSFVWVKIPQIDASSSTDYIYMYYGNASATDSQSATGVWDSNFKLVQHLKESSGTTTADSTSNGNNGTKVSETSPTALSSGKIGTSQTFNGTSDYVDTSYIQYQVTAYTIEAWVKTTSGNRIVQDRGSGAGRSLSFGATAYSMDTDGENVGVSTLATVADNTWRHVVGVWAASSGTPVASSQFKFYV